MPEASRRDRRRRQGLDGLGARPRDARAGARDAQGGRGKLTEIADLLALRDVTRGELENEADASVDEDVAYEALGGVDRVHAPSFSPAHFYFAGPELKLVYVPRTAIGGRPAQPWLDELGPGPQLASRTGKRAVLEVRPERGFAFSHQDGEVELAEVFPATTLDAYQRDIYEEPAPEIR